MLSKSVEGKRLCTPFCNEELEGVGWVGGDLAPFFLVKHNTAKPRLEHLWFCGCYAAHWLETRECPCSRFPLPEAGCAASSVAASPGKMLHRDHCSCTSIKQKMCSCESNPHAVSLVFFRAVQITFFFCTGERKSFFKELCIQIVCVSQEWAGYYL